MAGANTGKEYRLAIKIAGAVSSSFNNAIGDAEGKLSGLGSAAKKAAAIAAAAWGTLKLGQFVSDAVDTYGEFEQAMANTSAITGATTEEYSRLRDAALEMGKATTKSASECADALGYMGLAGWSVQDSISGLEPILRLSEATQMDLATCSDLVTDSMSALGVEVGDLSGYLDIAAQANNKSNQTAQMLMEAYIGVGGTMKNLKVPLEESATALGVMANRGIKGSEAGTALNAVINNLTTGTGQAGKMMERLGISAFDRQGNFIGLEETIRTVSEATKDMTDEERNAALAALGGKQHIDTLNALMSGLNTTTAEGISEWQALSDSLYNSDNALATMAGTVTNTWQGATARLDSAMDDLKINLVTGFAPYATDAINGVAEYIPKITEALVPMAQGFLGTALPKIQKFGKGAKTVLSAFREGGFSGGMDFLGSLLESSLPSVMDAGLEVVSGLSAGLRGNAGRLVDGAVGLAQKLAQGLADSIPTIVQHVPAIVSNIAGVVNDNAPKLIGAAANIIWTLAKGLVRSIPVIVQNLPQIIGAIVDAITAFNWMNLGNTILTGLGNGIKASAAQVKSIIAQVRIAVKGGLENLPAAMTKIGQNVLKGLWNGIQSAFGWLKSMVGNIVVSIIAVVKSLFGIASPSTVFADIGKNLILGLFEGISGIWNTITVFFSGAFNGLLSQISGFLPMLSTIAQGSIGTLQAVIGGIQQMLGGLITFVTGVFTGNWQQAWEGVRNIFSGIFQSLAALVKQPMNAVIAVVNGAIRGINSISVDVPDWVPVLGGQTLGFSIPEIPALAKGGIVNSPTILEAGEAGTEAIIPLSKLWSEMQGMITDALSGPAGRIEAITEYLASADIGRAVPTISELLAAISPGGGEPVPAAGGDSPPLVIYYQPQYHFDGDAPSREDLAGAEKLSQEEFDRMAAKWLKELERTRFRG